MKCPFVCVLLLIGISLSSAGILNNFAKTDILTEDASNASEVSSIYMFNRTHKNRSFIPFARPFVPPADENDSNCSADDGGEGYLPYFSDDQLRHGALVTCFLIAIYSFTLLAIICDKYFIPCIERLCEVLDISADVGAATFMSVATSCPELFTNIISTFITDSELGIGTIVGSSMFNSLGVASIGSLAASRVIQLDWWPVTRDICIYMIAISVLVVIVWDSVIYWYEGLTLFILYFVYFAVMFQNPRISRFVRRAVARFESGNKVNDISSTEEQEKKFNRDSVRASVVSAFGTYVEETRRSAFEHSEEFKKAREAEKKKEIEEIKKSPFVIPEGGWLTKFMFFYTWPLKMVLRCTIPNPKTHPKLFPISFVICIVWIGINSYIVSWMVSLIGVEKVLMPNLIKCRNEYAIQYQEVPKFGWK